MVAQTSGTMPTVGGPDATPDAGIVTVSPVYCGFAGTGLTGPPAVGATVAPQGVRADDFYVFAT
jgi:hypothetical protein